MSINQACNSSNISISNEIYSLYTRAFNNSETKEWFIRIFIQEIKKFSNQNNKKEGDLLKIVQSNSFKKRLKNYFITIYQEKSKSNIIPWVYMEAVNSLNIENIIQILNQAKKRYLDKKERDRINEKLKQILETKRLKNRSKLLWTDYFDTRWQFNDSADNSGNIAELWIKTESKIENILNNKDQTIIQKALECARRWWTKLTTTFLRNDKFKEVFKWLNIEQSEENVNLFTKHYNKNLESHSE